ncbi:MAG: SBBP repeat-containing protein [Neisseriaceae bacterium]
MERKSLFNALVCMVFIMIAVFALSSCGSGGGSSSGSGSNSHLVWGKQVGGSGGNVRGNGVSVNGSSNVYVVGDTDVKLSGESLVGISDAFITKYSNSGLHSWTKLIGNTDGITSGNGVVSDNIGVYIVGSTNVGLGNRFPWGNKDYFVVKYNDLGVLDWVRQNGNVNGATEGKGIALDNQGNVYVTGTTNVSLSGESQVGDFDTFVAKYDNLSGNQEWIRQLGISESDANVLATAISVDKSNNIYVTGVTNKALPNESEFGVMDFFIAKYNESGNLLWTKQFGQSGGTVYANGITIDDSGNIYVTGQTDVGLNGKPKIGINDAFISKYNESGALVWLVQYGQNNVNTYGNGISFFKDGNAGYVYVVGSTGGVGLSQSYFVSKYNAASGKLQWMQIVGSAEGVFGNGIAVSLVGDAYVTGTTSASIFNKKQGIEDYFIAKYK